MRTLLADPRRRRDTLSEVLAGNAWDPLAIVALPPSRATDAEVIRELRARGAPDDVYALSRDRAMDGRFVQLDETVRRLWSWDGGLFLSCVPGRLACWRPEHPGKGPSTTWILEARP